MLQKWTLSLVFFLSFVAVNAQFRKIPAVVTTTFKQKFNNASEVSWKDKITAFEADFTTGDKEMKAFFTSKGEWIKTETKYTFNALPTNIKEGFKKSKYADLTVVSSTQLEDPASGVQYKIVVRKNEYNKKNLLFSKTGQLMSDTNSF